MAVERGFLCVAQPTPTAKPRLPLSSFVLIDGRCGTGGRALEEFMTLK